jgi:hypothetical protein
MEFLLTGGGILGIEILRSRLCECQNVIQLVEDGPPNWDKAGIVEGEKLNQLLRRLQFLDPFFQRHASSHFVDHRPYPFLGGLPPFFPFSRAAAALASVLVFPPRRPSETAALFFRMSYSLYLSAWVLSSDLGPCMFSVNR